MSDDFANEISPPSKTNWFWTVIIVAVAGLFFAWFLRELQHPILPEKPHPSVGKPAPPIVAEGWLNGPGPTAEELAGKVCVVEAWAFWCGPCLQAAPHTAKLYEKYKGRDVVFVGLTGEGAATLKETREFIDRAKITWPSGYGAAQTLTNLDHSDDTPFPWAWVIDQQGQIAWAGDPLDLKEEILDELLHSPENASTKRL